MGLRPSPIAYVRDRAQRALWMYDNPGRHANADDLREDEVKEARLGNVFHIVHLEQSGRPQRQCERVLLVKSYCEVKRLGRGSLSSFTHRAIRVRVALRVRWIALPPCVLRYAIVGLGLEGKDLMTMMEKVRLSWI